MPKSTKCDEIADDIPSEKFFYLSHRGRTRLACIYRCKSESYMSEDTGKIIGKLLRDELDERERQRLLRDKRVEERMRSQWETEEMIPDPIREERIWRRIRLAIDGRTTRRVWLYKAVAVAASLLLLVGTGAVVYWASHQEARYMYVMASGIRSIESVSLPDGTRVRLGANSKLTYPDRFNGERRDVRLEGQAFFDVAKDSERPFTVHTDNMDVTALGTAFEVFDQEAEDKLEAILLNGKVRVGFGGNGTDKRREVVLSPDEMLVYDKRTHEARVRQVDAAAYSGWRTGILSFDNEPLSMILTRLEPWYGRTVECPRAIAEKYRFTFKVRDESLEQILFMLSNTSPIRYREKEGNYELYIKQHVEPKSKKGGTRAGSS